MAGTALAGKVIEMVLEDIEEAGEAEASPKKEERERVQGKEVPRKRSRRR